MLKNILEKKLKKQLLLYQLTSMMLNVKQLKMQDVSQVQKQNVSLTNQLQQLQHMVQIKQTTKKKSQYLTLVVVHSTYLSLNQETAYSTYYQQQETTTQVGTTSITKLLNSQLLNLNVITELIYHKIKWQCNV